MYKNCNNSKCFVYPLSHTANIIAMLLKHILALLCLQPKGLFNVVEETILTYTLWQEKERCRMKWLVKPIQYTFSVSLIIETIACNTVTFGM